MSKNLYIIIIGVIVVSLLGLGAYLIFGNSAPATTKTPVATKIVTSTIKPTTKATPVSYPVTKPESLPITAGVSGKVTAICGGPASLTGIGSVQGTCSRCKNLQGIDGSCLANSGEKISVWACNNTTNNKCDATVGGTKIASDIVTQSVYLSSYFTQGCTIQVTVEPASGSSSTAVDYIVWQKDNCTSTTPAPTKLCGNTCTDNLDCPSGNVCSSAKKCVLTDCNTDSSKCMPNDLCTTKSIIQAQNSKLCGASCLSTSECATGNVCLAGSCKATQCLTVSSPGCANGCLLTTKKCGDSCTYDNECPADNSCHEGKCIVDFCIDNKCKDSCKLPNTALISDEVDLLLVGLLAFVIGIIAWKTNFHVQLFYALGGRYLTAGFSESERVKLEREELEEKLKQRMEENKKAKQTRSNFETTILSTDPVKDK